MNVFDLFATLSLDSSNYEDGLSNAASSANSFGSRLSGGLATAARVGAAAVAATTAAVVAGSTAFINGVADVASYADNIDKMSQKLGMSAESYQEWDFIMQHAGTSIESMQASMKTLASAAESGNDAFEQLGLTQEQIASMSQEELFGATIEALQNVEDDTQRTYLAGQLLGRGATELGALLNMSAEDVDEMRQQVHDLGGVMSDEAVAAGAQYQDSLQNLQTALGGVKNQLLSDFLPSFITVMDGLSAIFSGDEGGLEMVSQGVNDFAEQMNETLPRFIEIAGNIIGILGQAIIDNLPTLIETGSTVIEQLANGLISNLPALVSAAADIIGRIATGLIQAAPQLLSATLEIISTLGNQLVENLPTMMTTITEVIVQMVEMFTSPDNIAMIIELSLSLMTALMEGLLAAIPIIVEALPTIINNIVTGLLTELPVIIQAGVTLLTALIENLPVIISTIVAALPQIINGILSALTASLPLIVDAGITLLTALITDLPIIVSTIAGALPQIIEGILGAITDNLPTIISAGVDLFLSLIDNLPEIIEGIVGAIPEIISSIVDVLVDSGSEIAETALTWGADLIDNLASGITNGISIVEGAVSNVAQGIRNFLGFSEPEEGPLSNFHTFAPDMVDLFSQGIDESIPTLERSLNNMSEFVADNIPSIDMADINARSNVNIGTTGNIMSNQPIVIPVYIGNEKIDELVVDSNQRTAFISGGRA
jgi:hypothetical protein